MLLTIVLSVIGTVVIASIVKAVMGLRPNPEDEEMGLDYTDHGEAGYHEDTGGGHMDLSTSQREDATAMPAKV